MKKIIIGVGALAILGGGGYAGGEFFLRDYLAEEEKTEKVELPPMPSIVTVGAFAVPVIEGNTVTRNIRVRIAVEMHPGKSPLSLRPKAVQLRDAYLTELNAMVMWHKTDGGHALHLPTMKKRLLKATEKVLGPDMVKEVLVNMIVEQG